MKINGKEYKKSKELTITIKETMDEFYISISSQIDNILDLYKKYDLNVGEEIEIVYEYVHYKGNLIERSKANFDDLATLDLVIEK